MSAAPEQTPSNKYTEKPFKSGHIDEDLIPTKQILSDYGVECYCCKACTEEIHHGKRVRIFLFLENKRLSP